MVFSVMKRDMFRLSSFMCSSTKFSTNFTKSSWIWFFIAHQKCSKCRKVDLESTRITIIVSASLVRIAGRRLLVKASLTFQRGFDKSLTISRFVPLECLQWGVSSYVFFGLTITRKIGIDFMPDPFCASSFHVLDSRNYPSSTNKSGTAGVSKYRYYF
jgi:hypothetical protein